MKYFPILIAFLLFGCKSQTGVSQGETADIETNKASHLFDQKEALASLKYLSSDELNGRGTNTEGNKKAREHIIKQLEELNVKSVLPSTFEQPFTFKSRSSKETPGINVLAKIEGKSKEVIVLTAHYDHLGFHDGKIYNGADDNASGTVALVAMADYFSKNKPEHTLVLAWVDAEEKGLQGARYLADNFPGGIEKVQLNVNMDMVSRKFKGANDLWMVGTHHYPALKPILQALESQKVNPRFGHDEPNIKDVADWTNSSDHGAFHAKEIPFIYFGVDDHPDYHKPTDDYENVDHEFYLDVIDFIISAVGAMDSSI